MLKINLSGVLKIPDMWGFLFLHLFHSDGVLVTPKHLSPITSTLTHLYLSDLQVSLKRAGCIYERSRDIVLFQVLHCTYNI